MVQDRNLPEGTDKITPGASVTSGDIAVDAASGSSATGGSKSGGAIGGGGSGGTGTTSTGPSGSQGSTSGSGSAASSSGGSSSGQSGSGGKIMDKVRSGGEKLSGQAAGKARDFVGQGLERSADSLTNVSRLVSETADGIDERLGSEYGDYARRVADAIDGTAEKFRSKNPEELIDDARDFVRKSPTAALAGAAILGFAVARLVKTGFDAARNDRGYDDNDSGSTGSGTGGTGGTSRTRSTGSSNTGSSSGETTTSGSTGTSNTGTSSGGTATSGSTGSTGTGSTGAGRPSGTGGSGGTGSTGGSGGGF